MEITEQDGLTVATVSRDEAEDGAWRARAAELDLVRLGEPGTEDAVLHRLGFTARPKWVNWVAPLGGSPDEWLASLGGTERRNVRLAHRFVAAEGMRLEVHQGLTERQLDAFLPVYDEQIAGMPRGRNFARKHRDRLLEGADGLLSVFVHADGGADSPLVAGSLWQWRPAESVLQLRFSAAAADARSGRVMRAAYAAAFDRARAGGLGYASLGNDPSLFGHVVQPGLFTFKSRLGFRALPSEVLNPELAGEFQDRFLSLRALADPSLVVAWGELRGRAPGWPAAADGPSPDLLVLTGDGRAQGLPSTGFRRTRVLAL
ncbi:GNAT family N-acetyltransferase [Kitasatospora sp. NPDC051853]|uniref:GNAT family N-acetyltransferase n=1 Tax=Kitasatospora sp. NPDC051853 TaxID=3364058 RepID=UPI00379B7442